MRDLLLDAANRAHRYLEELDGRPVFPTRDAIAGMGSLAGPLGDHPTDPGEVLALLDAAGSPATVATAGRRYFGFVVGGSLPAALAANWLAAAWDQPASMRISSPVGAKLEEIALGWMIDLLGLPTGTGAGFVTGATMANFAGLAAARHRVMAAAGWDVEADGLIGAPPIRVVVGDEAHATLFKALGLLGLGRAAVERVAVDDQGRMRPDALPLLDERTILCLQAGNVNTGASDPFPALIGAARQAGSWVHVDGAFGLWAAASPTEAIQVQGIGAADSWATDAHKWLNVPYDCGLVFVRNPDDLEASFSTEASYLIQDAPREPMRFTPESSRRARGVEVWAALVSLGRSGLAEMIARCCRHARGFAEGLSGAGFEILNEVSLNQVLVAFGDDTRTDEVVAAVQAEGTCWAGWTTWRGRRAMRISVSSWATTDEDVERSIEAIISVAKGLAVSP
ncbi:MAG TPA: aminotransferase class V-fold PLP-dependent enzyme [Acidimicrobiia bacterium]|nr:aminotransferase class V-fold PLP-dependent enzyme [Acidimicrobiia bacterium]